jgi:hypothetical protein
MKKELLEALTRVCIREVITQMREAADETDEQSDDGGNTKGAPAPPEDGQGTADQPEIPKNDSPNDSGNSDDATLPNDGEPGEKEPAPSEKRLKGAIFINPADKSRLQPMQILPTMDRATIERTLYRAASAVAGPRVKVSLAAQRMVDDAAKMPSSPVYLYLGKYDPDSEEIFLMADKSLQIAKSSSIPATELRGSQTGAIAPGAFNPMTATPREFGAHMTQRGQSPVHNVDEEFRQIVKKLVGEILNKR